MMVCYRRAALLTDTLRKDRVLLWRTQGEASCEPGYMLGEVPAARGASSVLESMQAFPTAY